jgi:hypothetical protein
MEQSTRWYHLLAYFFGGAFLANTIPHLVNGVSGLPFQSPFASPPGKGLSSSTVNVLWGMFNLAVAYGLVIRVSRFDLRRTSHVVALGVGTLLMALMLARTFGELHGGNLRPNADRDAGQIYFNPARNSTKSRISKRVSCFVRSSGIADLPESRSST